MTDGEIVVERLIGTTFRVGNTIMVLSITDPETQLATVHVLAPTSLYVKLGEVHSELMRLKAGDKEIMGYDALVSALNGTHKALDFLYELILPYSYFSLNKELIVVMDSSEKPATPTPPPKNRGNLTLVK